MGHNAGKQESKNSFADSSCQAANTINLLGISGATYYGLDMPFALLLHIKILIKERELVK